LIDSPNEFCLVSVVREFPILSLAPMQDVSVLPLWRCLERRGGPDVYVTEYFRVHRDSHPEKPILRSITQMTAEKPVVAQLIGNEPEHLARTSQLIQDASDCAGIDINLGCPAPRICGKLSGGALLRDRDLIRRIVDHLRPVVRGSLTLKTRVGFESPAEFEQLLELFAGLPIDGLAIHGRTVREKYQSAVHPEVIARAVQELSYPVTANGNIVTVATALAMHRKTDAAGLMIGRGGIRNPWIFEQVRAAFSGAAVVSPTLRDIREYLMELREEVQAHGDFDNETQVVNRLKKFTNYIASGIADGALNDELRRATTLQEFEESCDRYLENDFVFPEAPVDDGKLFCGFDALTDEMG